MTHLKCGILAIGLFLTFGFTPGFVSPLAANEATQIKGAQEELSRAQSEFYEKLRRQRGKGSADVSAIREQMVAPAARKLGRTVHQQTERLTSGGEKESDLFGKPLFEDDGKAEEAEAGDTAIPAQTTPMPPRPRPARDPIEIEPYEDNSMSAPSKPGDGVEVIEF